MAALARKEATIRMRTAHSPSAKLNLQLTSRPAVFSEAALRLKATVSMQQLGVISQVRAVSRQSRHGMAERLCCRCTASRSTAPVLYQGRRLSKEVIGTAALALAFLTPAGIPDAIKVARFSRYATCFLLQGDTHT